MSVLGEAAEVRNFAVVVVAEVGKVLVVFAVAGKLIEAVVGNFVVVLAVVAAVVRFVVVVAAVVVVGSFVAVLADKVVAVAAVDKVVVAVVDRMIAVAVFRRQNLQLLETTFDQTYQTVLKINTITIIYICILLTLLIVKLRDNLIMHLLLPWRGILILRNTLDSGVILMLGLRCTRSSHIVSIGWNVNLRS